MSIYNLSSRKDDFDKPSARMDKAAYHKAVSHEVVRIMIDTFICNFGRHSISALLVMSSAEHFMAMTKEPHIIMSAVDFTRAISELGAVGYLQSLRNKDGKDALEQACANVKAGTNVKAKSR